MNHIEEALTIITGFVFIGMILGIAYNKDNGTRELKQSHETYKQRQRRLYGK